MQKSVEDILKANAKKCNLELESYKKLLYCKQLTQNETEHILENYRFFGNYDSDSKEVFTEQQSTHNEKTENYNCVECNKAFRNQFSINLHKKASHSSKREFKCDVVNCEKTFTHEGWFARHRMSHTPTQKQ